MNILRVLASLKLLFIYGNTMIRLLFLILMELWPDLMWLVTFQMFYTLIIHTAEYIIYTIKFKGKILQNFDTKILKSKGSSAQVILFLKWMSERGGSDISRLWNWIFNRFSVDLEIRHSFSESFYVGSDVFRHWFQK